MLTKFDVQFDWLLLEQVGSLGILGYGQLMRLDITA